tara:strand:- start:53 stop:415 length:363 start_codon:yes stop_codon:yes gene_type:complete
MNKVIYNQYNYNLDKLPEEIIYNVYQYIGNDNMIKYFKKNILLEIKKNRERRYINELLESIDMDDDKRNKIIKMRPTIEDLVDLIKNKHRDNEKKTYLMLLVPIRVKLIIRKEISNKGLL